MLMRNSNKPENIAHKNMNSYERSRMLRIQENQARLRQSGILNITKALTNSVEGQKRRKVQRKKNNPSNEKDPDYSPDLEANYEGETCENVITAGVHKQATQVKTQRFISPLSMKNYVNTVRLQQGISDDHRRLAKGKSKQDNNKDLTKVNMASIILQRKRIQAANKEGTTSDVETMDNFEQLNELFEGPSFQELYKDVNEVEHMDVEGSTNEDMYSGEEQEREDHADQYEVESEPENLEQIVGNRIGIEGKVEKKTRGPTMMHKVHTRSIAKRKEIILNEFGQPVGPVTDEADTVGEFSRFLGTIARDYGYAPLVHKSWHKVPNKNKIWEYVLSKYIVPKEGKDWVLKTIGCLWRLHKCRFKRQYYCKHKDNKARWKNRPKVVPEEDFTTLLSKWNKKEEKIRSSLNRERRLAQKNMHTVGPKSFARVREEMVNEDPNKQPPSLAQMFVRTRERKEGNVYKESYEDTSKKIEAMNNYIPPEDGSGPNDAFHVVMPNKYNGRCRLYGKGVTEKKLKKVVDFGTSQVFPVEDMKSLKASVEAEKTQAANMRKELEEDYAKKMMELQEDHNKKMSELETMKETMVEDVMAKILSKIPFEVARHYLN